MLGPDGFRALAEQALGRSSADQTEVVLVSTDAALTRFAGSAIHQNVVERDAEVRVRAVIGLRVGVARTNDLSADGLARVVERAAEIARRQPEDPDFPGLPEWAPIQPVDGYRAETAACSPDRRALMVKTICDLALERRLTASGAFTTEAG